MSERRPTPKAARECAAWLIKCLGFGWSRDALDDLEALWWKYHDDQGRLVSAAPPPAAPTPAASPRVEPK